jgi:hypothetical protein
MKIMILVVVNNIGTPSEMEGFFLLMGIYIR